MIVDITAAPGEEFGYDQTQAIKAAIAAMGHRIDFIDVWNTWDEDYYVRKLEKKSPSVSRDYIRRKRQTEST